MKNNISGKIRALIVDDEIIAREGIRMYLANETDVEIVGECSNGLEAVTAIREQAPNLVFLDVQMPGMDGLTVVQTIGVEKMPTVIFVTAYDKYAVHAFDVCALDYLLKPFDRKRFLTALARARTIFHDKDKTEVNRQLLDLFKNLGNENKAELSNQNPALKYQERFVIKKAGRIFFRNTDEIDWIETADNYVKLHTGNESHLIRGTITSLESKLDPNQFLRIRRTIIINIGHIKELQPLFNGEYTIVFRSGAEVTSSRRFRKNINLLLGE